MFATWTWIVVNVWEDLESGITTKIGKTPSITDGVHCNENFVEIIPVFSTF